MKTIGTLPLVLAMGAGLALFGCEEEEEAPSAAEEAAPTEEEPAEDLPVTDAMKVFEEDDALAEIEIEGTDQMTYSIDEFSVKPGQMVRLTLEHVGNLPADAMGHNVVIIEQGEDYMEFTADANEAGGALENDYLPAGVRDRVIAYTDMIGGGETATVEFRAPEEPGEYPFLCTFPGHAAQMNGIMKVGE
ncbi:MAG: plastocyanin/azurin family copper-binding protein [Myxococcota bacterium]